MRNVEHPRTLFSSTWVTTTVASGATVYGCAFSGSSLSASEGTRRNMSSMNGVLKCFYVVTSTSQPGTGSLVCTLRRNTSNTSMVVTIAAGSAAGVFSDTVNTQDVNGLTGAVFGVMMVNNASSTSAALIGGSFYLYN